MKLIEPLVCGVIGAENGRAELYLRGTSTRASFYSSFEGDLHVSSGQNLTLDARGGTTVYVDALVTVIVKNQAGTEIRRFTAGETAAAVELVSSSFTGTDYTSGASGAGEPTTVHAALSRWFASAGATDFEVLFNGAPERIQDALGSIAGIFYNVKSPEYGAVGDGTAQDATAVQAALTAAGAAGGGIVWFPKGTYRVNATLNVPAKVSIWGAGAGAAILKIDHATAHLLSYAAASTTPVDLRGLTLEAHQANSGRLVTVGVASVLHIDGCSFSGTNHTGTCVFVDDFSTKCRISRCLMVANGPAAICVEAYAGASSFVEVASSSLTTSQSAFDGTLIALRTGVVVNCDLALNLASSGTMFAIVLNGSGTGPIARVIGNRITGSTGGQSYGIYVAGGNLASTNVAEAGNIFGSSLTSPLMNFITASNFPQFHSTSRDGLTYEVSHSSGALAVAADQWGTTIINQTSNDSFTVNSTLPPEGALFTLIFYNNSGGVSGTVTYGTNFRNAGETFTAVTNQLFEVRHFRCIALGNGTLKLVPLGPTGHNV